METLDGEDNAVLTSEMSKGNDKAAKQYNIVYKYKNPEVDQAWLEGERSFIFARLISQLMPMCWKKTIMTSGLMLLSNRLSSGKSVGQTSSTIDQLTRRQL